MKEFLRLVVILLFLLFIAYSANAQTCPEMPDGLLCVPRAVGVKALEDADARKALEAQVKTQDEAYALLKTELENMRIEFARVSGENSALKQNAVSDRALIEILVKYARPKKIGLNIF